MTISYAKEIGAALIVERRWREIRIARVNGWAPGQQCMGQGGATVVFQWSEHRIRVDLVARAG